ncbi:hypothetical protein Xoosp13_364 [Xanthomonas phage Xoo-sp13]|nr:hypothetical protein Xoosp13_364 [Xanthomonas phage Xoo-sp13]
MDTTELLKKVLDAVINEDDVEATVQFKAYATAKVKDLIEGAGDKEKAAKIAKKKEKKCDDDTEAGKVAAGLADE